jgi:hypothetical protein
VDPDAVEALCPSQEIIWPSEIAFLDHVGASTDDKLIAAPG